MAEELILTISPDGTDPGFVFLSMMGSAGTDTVRVPVEQPIRLRFVNGDNEDVPLTIQGMSLHESGKD